MLKALLWDVDGTLAETERDGHRVAFNQAFEAMQVPWRWDERRFGELRCLGAARRRRSSGHLSWGPSGILERGLDRWNSQSCEPRGRLRAAPFRCRLDSVAGHLDPARR